MSSTSTTKRKLSPANRLGLDYAGEADGFPSLPYPIIDFHSHINGVEAAKVYLRAADLYGVGLTVTMSQLEQVEPLREAYPGRFEFIAVPNYFGEDRLYHHGKGFIERIEKFHQLGVRIVKFWAAPRGIDFGHESGEPGLLRLDSPQRIEAMEVARELGMIFMTHIADPDTWFAAKYNDPGRYGSKRQQYEPLEELLQRYDQPWIAAHLGGWPENLEFLSGLLTRHKNLYLDTSATKWMVREVSRHSREDLLAFFTKWKGRILFGSDIVTSDDHLLHSPDDVGEYAKKASNREEAFDLYAGRYWALRTLWEREYDGESPIADPDLAMVEPGKFDVNDASLLRGKHLPADLLQALYHDTAQTLLGR